MENKIVDFKTAELAAKKGFDWIESDDKFYDCYGDLDHTHRGYQESVNHYSRTPAPEQSLLQKWLRDVHGYHIQVSFDAWSSGDYTVSINRKGAKDFHFDITKDFKTYEDALEYGLFETLLFL